MKKWMFTLIAALILQCMTAAALAEESGEVILPAALAAVEAEAFEGNTEMTSLVIPKTVQTIGSRAFASCQGLREVYFGKNASLTIAPDAFEGCGDIHFNAYPDTPGELFALAHGYRCDRLEEGSPFLESALKLVSQNGGTTSIFQGSEFSTKRLVVRMLSGRLPDISAYKPTNIVMKPEDGIFYVQFGEVQDTMDCCSFLNKRRGYDVGFVTPDACVEVIDDVEAMGTVSGKWDTNDPMGFDVYAPYVADNSSGKVTIAIIDSGVKELSTYSGRLRDGLNLVADGKSWSEDGMVHGSMIAGIIHDCVGNNNVEILPIRVAYGSNKAQCSMIAEAIDYAVERGADIINLSLNFDENEYVRYAIGKAVDARVRVVVAAGNSHRNIDRVFPANVQGTIVVSGIDSGYRLSSSSNYGDNVSYCAPDTDVMCTSYLSYQPRKGTSFAAPMVASALALAMLDDTHSEADLMSACEQLTPGVSGVNNYGYGLMRLDRLISTESTYIISYDANGGDNAPASQEKVPGISARLTREKPNRNYTVTLNDGEVETTLLVAAPFMGWNTVSNGSGTNYAPGANYIKDASVKLYAQWDAGVLAELPTIKRTEYYFEGWFTSPTGGVPVDSETVISRDVTLYAHWTSRQKYIVTYNANGGMGAPDNEIKLEDLALKLSATKPTKSWTVTLNDNNGTTSTRKIELTFDSWNTKEDGTGTKYAAGASYEENAGVTLYAQWINGKLGELPTPTREGYVFTGWTTEADGGTAVTADSEVTGNLTFYAQWARVYNISIDGESNLFINNDDPGNPVQTTSQLTATVSPSGAYDKTVIWSSSNTSVATVSSTGLVTTVSPGSATITAKLNIDSSKTASVTITVKNKWSAWSAWSDTAVSATSIKQVQTRTMYKSTTTSYGGWGGWSNWSLSAQSSTDTRQVESQSVWGWFYFPCPNCGFHMWAYCCNCAGWAGGCGRYFGASNMEFLYLPHSHYASDCAWNFGGVGSNRVRYYDSTYGWVYGQEDDHNAKTGYRYRTRSKDVSESGWQTTPISPVNTDTRIVRVSTKTQYSYRTQNTF